MNHNSLQISSLINSISLVKLSDRPLCINLASYSSRLGIAREG